MPESLKAEDLIKELFDKTLLDSSQFDQEVVSIVKSHLVSSHAATKAYEKITTDLEQLVSTRVEKSAIRKAD
jgi:predicted metal-binding transcription factor (methanogenesis marker protein 9)